MKQELPIYADVILPVPLRQKFTYKLPEHLRGKVKPGSRIIVQFGSRKLNTALVRDTHSNQPDIETKLIETLLDAEPLVCEQELSFWDWMAEYYACTPGEVMKAALPSGFILESHSHIRINSEWVETCPLTDHEESIYQFLREQKKATIQQINSYTKKANAYPYLQSMLKKGAIEIDEKLDSGSRPKTISHIRISGNLRNDSDFETAFRQLAKAPKQLQLFMWLLNELNHFSDHKKESIAKKTMIEKTRTSDATLKGLIDKGFVELFALEIERIPATTGTGGHQINLSAAQEEALNLIHKHFIRHQVVLLHGVTASGKTEVYIKLIEEQLRAGKQVLYLLPEIALTSQMIGRLKLVFGNKAGIYHSKFSDAERVEIWKKVMESHLSPGSGYPLIVGVRSALFLPFRKLGLVIVDEEHEISYKQFDPAPRYNARDSAVILALLHGAKVVMGTATPSFETFHNARSGKYGYVQLNQRFHPVEMPRVIIADLKESYKRKEMRSHLTPLLFSEIEGALSRNEQIILFQNRRGFSPYIQCRNCSWVPRCKHCDVSLTYHKQANNLQCHYCGFTLSLPAQCPDCQSTDVQSKGFGTEKAEDELKIIFPGIEIGRLDLDTTRTKTGHERVLERFASGKTKILVGTQMVTKGLDFENVSVVGILNADNLLNFPDFRSFERAYQLMSQVSGRAGRKSSQGKVIIQTWQPNHPVTSMVTQNDYETLFRQSLPERKLFQYPPWFRLIYITVKHKNQQRAQTASTLLANQLRKKLKNRVLGPEPPLIGRIQQYYQYMIRIKFEKNISPSDIKNWVIISVERIKHTEQNSGVIFQIDVDPL